MGLNSQRTPNVDALARSGHVAGLVEAAQHTDVQTGRDGTTSDAGAPIREAAILSLAEIGDQYALPVVTTALSDPSDRVRCAAIRALYGWGEAQPLAEAVAWLAPQGASRALALSAIAKLADPKTAAVLTTSLVHGSAQAGVWEEEAETVSALCGTHGRRRALVGVLAVLVEALENGDDEVAARAEDFLLWLGDDAAPAVKAAIPGSSAPHRAVWILGRIGGALAVEPLIEALTHDQPRTRAEACVGLGELRDPIAVEALFRAIRDTDHIVRVKAAAALDSIGTAALVTALSTVNSSADARRSRADTRRSRAAGRRSPNRNGAAGNGAGAKPKTPRA